MQQPLSALNLSKRFGSVIAVEDLSFEVAPGKVTGFLGPNGAGKTTTLRMLLGLVKPSQGRALVRGRQFPQLADPMRAVGAHLAVDSFDPGRTGRAHMQVACAQGGVNPHVIARLLELVGMSKAADRRMGEYSLGMRQRLGLATALLGDPEILILDEPANGLDPEGIRWLRELLGSLAAAGKTVFVSSHLLGEVQSMASDVVIINEGRLVASGSLKELEEAQPAAVLVGSPQLEALRESLTAAHFTVSSGGASSGEAQRGAASRDLLTVEDADTEAVGRLALVAGVPLSHLSFSGGGLEELYMGLIGAQR